MTLDPLGRRQRILVVDDDEDIRDLLASLLSAEGYELRLAPDGVAALEIASAWRPDAIVLDLRMPRMGGATFCERYRERQAPRARILVLTAGGHAATEAARVGADAGVDKPFDVDVLCERLRKLLEPDQPAAAAPA